MPVPERLMNDIQTAIEIEIATLPLYLYSYYTIAYNANDQSREAGYTHYSVFIEEMLHLALACNLKRSLGGMPELVGKSPDPFLTQLPQHAPGFVIPLAGYFKAQLGYFMQIEKPDYSGAESDRKWHTIGEFYKSVWDQINEDTTDADYGYHGLQLGPHNGFYTPNNSLTVLPYPGEPETYLNDADSGDLVVITDKASAQKAIQTIVHQGEGFQSTDYIWDDPAHAEHSHYEKFTSLHAHYDENADKVSLKQVLINPRTACYPEYIQPLSNLTNAVYAYLFMMLEECFRRPIPGQTEIFNFGMHKTMIFILSSLASELLSQGLPLSDLHIVEPTAIPLGASQLWASPTFEKHEFLLGSSPKEQMLDLCQQVPAQMLPSDVPQRISDLPDVPGVPGERIKFS